jgi:hypothetical protein
MGRFQQTENARATHTDRHRRDKYAPSACISRVLTPIANARDDDGTLAIVARPAEVKLAAGRKVTIDI